MTFAATPDDLLTVPQAAELLGISKSLVQVLLTDKTLTARKHGPHRAWVLRRGDLDAFQALQDSRMSVNDVRKTLGLRTNEGVRLLIEQGDLLAYPTVLGRRGGMEFDRVQVLDLAQARARRLNTKQAMERFGMSDPGTLQRWVQETGGTIHWTGSTAAYEPEDVDRARQACRPEGGIDVDAVAAMLDLPTKDVTDLVARGDLPALTSWEGEGLRFDRPTIERIKYDRIRSAMHDVIQRWYERCAVEPTEHDDGVERSRDGGRIYRAKRPPTSSVPPVQIPEAWRAW
ncbi:TPA: helix-turn-helix domain-containing protein [Burkholderia vietnamiensis]|nr:helix-turn-helix domain-containing protein [Burkholderia vietnamiensis]